MQAKTYLYEFLISLVLLVFLVLTIFHNQLILPEHIENIFVVIIILTYIFFAGIIWREKPRDEREVTEVLKASRFSFLVGVSILLLGVTIQSLNHAVDPWLATTLISMITAKIFIHIYNKYGQ